MPSHDDTHFNKYTEENEAKHKILGDYLPAYINALKNRVTAFHYIDGFAGRGTYDGGFPGSPVLVLDKIAKADLLPRTSLSLVEDRRDYFEELQDVLQNNQHTRKLLDAPFIQQGKFSDYVDEILARPIYKKPGNIATFAFVDPCGVDGVRMRDMMRILSGEFSELLLFFNYDGVNRLIGGAEKGTHDSRILAELYGSEEAVKVLLAQLANKPKPEDREKVIRRLLIAQLISNGARYVLPFRFPSKTGTRTSHYLVHCCNHCLGFKLMKHVMWGAGKTTDDDYGRLDFVTASVAGGQLDLLRPDIDLKKKQILEDLLIKQCRVGDYIREQICKPSDVFSEQVYKKVLIELEGAGELVVYDKENINPVPQDKRKKRNERPTLGDSYWLRLA